MNIPDSRSLHVQQDDEPKIEDDRCRYFWRFGWNSCRDAMLAAAPTPPAPEVEPVGFLFRAKTDNKLTHFCRMEELSFWRTMGETELLYTRPANDGLRKAAEDVFAILNHLHHDRPETRRLRAELDKR